LDYSLCPMLNKKPIFYLAVAGLCASLASQTLVHAQSTRAASGATQGSGSAVEQKKNERDILKIIADAEGKLAAALHLPAIDSASISESSLGQFSSELVLRAMTLLGINYKFGGNTPETGFDCSGFVRYVFKEGLGVALPRRAEEISQKGQRVSMEQLVPGDLVFFNTLKRTFSHVGIYIGNNQFVHAPSSGSGVRVENIDKSYWQTRFDGARRLITGEATSAQ
jgi:cell wall-associated NlpC family hydrolase